MRHSSWNMHLGLAAGVDEEQRRLVLADRARRSRPWRSARVWPGPGQALRRYRGWRRVRRRPGDRDHEVGQCSPGALRHQPARAARRGRRTVADRPIVLHAGRELPQPRQPERQQVAALGGDERVQFVEDDALAGLLKKRFASRRGEQQRQLFRRGQQDVGRVELLALALALRRVAGAGLDRDRQPHLARPACSRLRSMSTASALSGEM